MPAEEQINKGIDSCHKKFPVIWEKKVRFHWIMKKRLITYSISSYGEMNLNSINSVSHNDGTINNDIDSTLKQITKESYRVSISNHMREIENNQ